MNDDVPEELRILQEGWRLVGNDVQVELVTRGWQVANPDVADDEPLEFFWPPTAPTGYGRPSERHDYGTEPRPRARLPRSSPWTAPTRITRTEDGWRLTYGRAPAQKPGKPVTYRRDSDLLADLDRIEWWPMSAKEARRIQRERLYVVTAAMANDDHYLAFTITEPYASQMAELMDHLRFDAKRQQGLDTAEKPASTRPRGDLHARLRLLDAAAWASAVRTARAGGDDGDPEN